MSVWKSPEKNEASRIFQQFSRIPSRKFEKRDFRMLIKVLSVVRAEWKGIGVILKIPPTTLKVLSDMRGFSAERSLISVVSEWMKDNYRDKRLYPCWCSVVYIVADSMGGRDPSAAWTIAQQWKEYEDEPFFDCQVIMKTQDVKISLHTLNDDDRSSLIHDLFRKLLYEVKNLWYEIGVLLGLPMNELEMIHQKHDQLKEVITQWIGLYFKPEFDYLPAPTLAILVDAVAHVMGGANQAVAKNLAEYDLADILRQDTTLMNQYPPPAGDSSGSPTISSSNTPPQSTTEDTTLPDEPVEWQYHSVQSDGPGRIQQYEAHERGSFKPHLKLHDDDRPTPVFPQEFYQERPDKLNYYNMTALKHGAALIFNNKHFYSSDHTERVGTVRDEQNIIQTCLYLGYRPVVCRDFSKAEILRIFSNLDKFLEDSNAKAKEKVAMDSLLCFVLSHGVKGAIISSDSQEIKIEEIEKLTGESQLLNSKPKIFFLQACQGTGSGTEPIERVRSDGTTSRRSDFYFCYATVPGDKSYRDIYTGSWFITEVCKTLCEFATCDSLHSNFQLRLNENVAGAGDVAGGYRYFDRKQNKWFCQQPTGSNQLTKHVHFFDRRNL